MINGQGHEVVAVFRATERLLVKNEVEPGFIKIGFFEEPAAAIEREIF
jgi:hypothetical protein